MFPDMSAMVMALTHVVAAGQRQRDAGETTISFGTAPPPPPSVCSPSSSGSWAGQKRGREEDQSGDSSSVSPVSVPTFKRYCRQNGISWWNGEGCSLIEPEHLNNSIAQFSSSSKPLEVQPEKEISTLLGARHDAVTAEIMQPDSSNEQICGGLGANSHGQKVESAEKICVNKPNSKRKYTFETPKREYKTRRLATYDDLKPFFGWKRADAAKAMGVSVPTFKRYCRQNGITWWNGEGCSLVEPNRLNNSVHKLSSGSKPLEVHGEKEIPAFLGARQYAVIVKASYGEHTAKFQLSSESRVVDLKEAVAKVFELEVGSFYVSYRDGEEELILISRDEDLQECVEFSSSLGNQIIRLRVTDKSSKSEESRKSC